VPEVNVKIPQVPNNEWRETMHRFDGQWMPDVDGALIGPENYQTLENLRYKDSGLEGVNGYTKVNTAPIATYTQIRTGQQLRTDKTQDTYILVNTVNSGGQGRIYVNRTAPGSQGPFDTTSNFWQDADDVVGGGADVQYPYFQDASSGLTGRFSDAPQGNIAYCNGEEAMIFGGDEQRVAAAFSCTTDALALPKDITEQINNELQTTANKFTWDQSDRPFTLLMTTRPIQALKIYVASANAADSTLEVSTWTGAAFGANLVDTDGTASGGASLAQTGVVSLTAHTDGTSEPLHFEELYLYAYLVELKIGAGAAPSADVYHITVDYAFQGVKDVWDGVYRQPIQFQVLNDTVYYDYTLQVNESSSVAAPVGAELDGNGTNANDKVYIMFEDRMSAIKFTMLGDKINSNAVTINTFKYWDGDGYQTLTITDGTEQASGKTASGSGIISWSPPSDEEPQTEFGSFGYMYEIDYSGALSADVIVDICTGVPAQLTVRPFDFSAIYGTRLVLGGYSKGDEGNRLDYSVANAPDAWNGFAGSELAFTLCF
jgi:hypothetical protein